MKRCWICGSSANTREHITKKSNIVQIFGRGPYQKGNRLIKNTDTETIFVQSPNSDHLKFKSTLCHSCNTTNTQLFDRAYEIFFNYINQNESEIIEYRQINLRRVFRIHGHYEKRVDLLKYFVKVFGCCLTNHNFSVSHDLSKSIMDKSLPNNFGLIFSILSDSEKPIPIFTVQDLECIKDVLTGEYVGFVWAQSYNRLSVTYVYECGKNSNIENLWTGTKSKIPLGYIDTNIEIS